MTERTRPKTIYVCHPFRADPEGNAAKCARICAQLVALGFVPIAPQVYLPAFIDEETQRDEAMAQCLHLLSLCDEIWVFGTEPPTTGMVLEIEHAASLGIPARTAVL